jgi:hypothetical protein
MVNAGDAATRLAGWLMRELALVLLLPCEPAVIRAA